MQGDWNMANCLPNYAADNEGSMSRLLRALRKGQGQDRPMSVNPVRQISNVDISTQINEITDDLSGLSTEPMIPSSTESVPLDFAPCTEFPSQTFNIENLASKLANYQNVVTTFDELTPPAADEVSAASPSPWSELTQTDIRRTTSSSDLTNEVLRPMNASPTEDSTQTVVENRTTAAACPSDGRFTNPRSQTDEKPQTTKAFPNIEVNTAISNEDVSAKTKDLPSKPLDRFEKTLDSITSTLDDVKSGELDSHPESPRAALIEDVLPMVTDPPFQQTESKLEATTGSTARDQEETSTVRAVTETPFQVMNLLSTESNCESVPEKVMELPLPATSAEQPAIRVVRSHAEEQAQLALLEPKYQQALRITQHKIQTHLQNSPSSNIVLVGIESEPYLSDLSLHLGILLAKQPAQMLSILLVDANSGSHSLSKRLVQTTTDGLNDLLDDTASVNDVVLPCQTPGLSFLPRGRQSFPQRPSAMRKLPRLLKQLQSQHDAILIDAGGISDSTAESIVQWCDSSCFVLPLGAYTADDIAGAVDKLQGHGAQFLGTILFDPHH